MGLSKRAKRELAIFRHIQTETARVKYLFHPQRMMIDLNAVPAPIVQAGIDAIRIMRENANAIQKLSESQNDTIPPVAEGRTEPSVHLQQKDGQSGSESPETR